MDHRLAGGRGHRADGLGCLLPDACVGQPARWRRLSPVVVEPVRRELSAERAASVMNHGQGLGKIRTEPIGGHVCNCRGMSGEERQEEGGHLTFVAVEVGADQHRCRHRCGAQQIQDRHLPGCVVVGVVAVPAQTPPAQHQTMDPAAPVDHSQRVVQMPAAHW